MKSFIDLLRVRQWVKNAFLVFPLIFSGRFTHWNLWGQCLWGVAAFCLLSSGMYIINDIVDLKQDRLHPRKSKRPLAAKQIGVRTASTLALLTLILGCIISWALNKEFFVLAIAYILLHTLYNMRTKHLVIVDVLTVAFGFQIRIWAGSSAVGVVPSLWLQMCVFVLAMFLGFTKRRHEISTLKTEAASHRGVLSHYTSYLLDQIIIICSTLTIVFYGLYTISDEIVHRIGGYEMFYSTAFVIYGIFRYLYLIHVKKMGDDPSEMLLSDRPMILNIFLWIIFCMTVIYLSTLTQRLSS